MPATLAEPRTPAQALYDLASEYHGEAMVASRRNEPAEAAFLVGLSGVVRRWADVEAAKSL